MKNKKKKKENENSISFVKRKSRAFKKDTILW